MPSIVSGSHRSRLRHPARTRHHRGRRSSARSRARSYGCRACDSSVRPARDQCAISCSIVDVSGQTLRRTCPDRRPTTPYAVVLERTAPFLVGSRYSDIHRLGFRVGKLLPGAALQRRRLQAVAPRQEHRVVQVEFVGEVLRGNARSRARSAQSSNSLAGQDRAGEHVKNRIRGSGS